MMSDISTAAEAIYQEARRLAGADADDNCASDYDQSALNWVRNRQQQLAVAALTTRLAPDRTGRAREAMLLEALRPFAQLAGRRARFSIAPDDPIVLRAKALVERFEP